MAVKVRLGNFEATIENYRWTSPDARLAEALNARLNPSGPEASDPDPDHTAAQAAARDLDGVIVEADDEEPDTDYEGMVL